MERFSKKKIHHELKLYCPLHFNDEETFQFYSKIKAKILAINKAVQDEDDVESKNLIQELDRFFIDESKPMDFDSDSPDNAALLMDANFEALCAILESNGVTNAANLTTLQFYLRIEHFKKINQSYKRPQE